MKEYKYTINGKKYEVAIKGIEDNIADITVNGEEYKVEMEKQAEPEKKKVVVRPAAPAPAQSAAPASAAGAKVNTANAIKAPLPGVVTEIKVAVGDTVSAGDTVVVLEAMKMANNLSTEKAGKVTAILVQQGESGMEDTPLVVIEQYKNQISTKIPIDIVQSGFFYFTLLFSGKTTVGLKCFASSKSISAYDMMMMVSPTRTFLAAAPLRQIHPVPRLPLII